jgi:hypothetical protein
MIAVYALTIDAPAKCADECDAEFARLTSARTATRTFDLQLAIATLRLPAPALCRDWNESERFR